MRSADPIQARRRTHWRTTAPTPHTNYPDVPALCPQIDFPYIAKANLIFNDEVAWKTIAIRAIVCSALEKLLANPVDEEKNYDVTSHLLNHISQQYLKHKYGGKLNHSTTAVVFASMHDQMIPEDYLVAVVKPAWQASSARYDILVASLEERIATNVHPAAAMAGGGQGGPKETEPVDQTKWYLSVVKMFRPDLATVHGFQLAGGKVQMCSLNACGVVTSEARNRGNLDAWIALVVMLYHSSDARDQRLQYTMGRPSEDASYQRNVFREPDAQAGAKEPKAHFSMFPLYVSHCPRRMAWTACQPGEAPERVSRHDFRNLVKNARAAGFLKVSWQRPSVSDESAGRSAAPVASCDDDLTVADKVPIAEESNAKFGGAVEEAGVSTADPAQPLPNLLPMTEGEPRQGHTEHDWLLGLVCCYFPQGDATIEMAVDHTTHVRFKELLHLASLGEPLSQCESPLQILQVAHDLAETHLQMLVQKITIHRDLSWFNVSCNPWHDPETEKLRAVFTGVPCIGTSFGDESGKPHVILIDLDHANHTDRIWKPDYKTGIERTGTPMFVARELSGVGRNCIDYSRFNVPYEKLTTALTEVEKYPGIYARAFPDDSGARFTHHFAEVVEREKTRVASEERTRSNPLEPHRAHHDVESIYWWMLWTFARALPEGSEAFLESDASILGGFCELMLRHKMGDEWPRRNLMDVKNGCEEVLHSDLVHFAKVLKWLAQYLSIPWHIYIASRTVDVDHAHHAFRRLLLAEIVYLRSAPGQQYDIALDKTQPRIFRPSSITVRQDLPANRFLPKPSTRHSICLIRKLDAAPRGDERQVKKAKVEGTPEREQANDTGEDFSA
ncbi:hypothetical protein AURDEDRAFT_162497 [Auricularia subglabra TFB-10046 SS5]|nr:hypothetical protein AURDEDRAFT_162497 [Auricularia subglabra TFB-10046 SS5]